jgi:hypothetical protein
MVYPRELHHVIVVESPLLSTPSLFSSLLPFIVSTLLTPLLPIPPLRSYPSYSLANKGSISAMSTNSASLSTSTERAIEVLAGLVGRTHVKEEIVHGSYRYVRCLRTLYCAVLQCALCSAVLNYFVLYCIDTLNIALHCLLPSTHRSSLLLLLLLLHPPSPPSRVAASVGLLLSLGMDLPAHCLTSSFGLAHILAALSVTNLELKTKGVSLCACLCVCLFARACVCLYVGVGVCLHEQDEKRNTYVCACTCGYIRTQIDRLFSEALSSRSIQ